MDAVPLYAYVINKKKVMSKIINLDTEELWAKITEVSRSAGQASTRHAIQLCYVMVSKETPRSDKLLIFSALSYLVLPVD